MVLLPPLQRHQDSHSRWTDFRGSGHSPLRCPKKDSTGAWSVGVPGRPKCCTIEHSAMYSEVDPDVIWGPLSETASKIGSRVSSSIGDRARRSISYLFATVEKLDGNWRPACWNHKPSPIARSPTAIAIAPISRQSSVVRATTLSPNLNPHMRFCSRITYSANVAGFRINKPPKMIATAPASTSSIPLEDVVATRREAGQTGANFPKQFTATTARVAREAFVCPLYPAVPGC